MTIARLDERGLRQRLRGNRLFLQMGPFLLRLGSQDDLFAQTPTTKKCGESSQFRVECLG